MCNSKLTSRSYWENYYIKQHTDKSHIVNVCSYYDRFWDTFFSGDSKTKSLIEIGGFPGRYLAYLA